MKKLIRRSETKTAPIHEDIQCYAVTREYTRDKAFIPEEFRSFAAELMTSIADSCMAHGAKEIGHIKAHLEYETGFLSADTLGNPADVVVEGRDGEAARQFAVVINAVVFGLTQEEIKVATEEPLENVSLRFGCMKMQ